MENGEISRWNRAAVAYSMRHDELTSIYRPMVDELLGCVTGKRILDAGCGDGRHALSLASRGATVVSVDGSSEMIALAEQSSGGLRGVLMFTNSAVSKQINAVALPAPGNSGSTPGAPKLTRLMSEVSFPEDTALYTSPTKGGLDALH